MGAAFISMWNQLRIADERDGGLEGKRLVHSASNQYRRAGIGVGDRVYIVGSTPSPHHMILIGCLLTSHGVMDQAAAERYLRCALYDSDDHIVGDGSIVRFDRTVPFDVVRRIRRTTGTSIKLRPGTDEIKPQTLRACGEITPESAALLDAVLAP